MFDLNESHIWSLLLPIHVKSGPKDKIGEVQVHSSNNSPSPDRKLYLVIISHKKNELILNSGQVELHVHVGSITALNHSTWSLYIPQFA